MVWAMRPQKKKEKAFKSLSFRPAATRKSHVATYLPKEKGRRGDLVAFTSTDSSVALRRKREKKRYARFDGSDPSRHRQASGLRKKKGPPAIRKEKRILLPFLLARRTLAIERGRERARVRRQPEKKKKILTYSFHSQASRKKNVLLKEKKKKGKREKPLAVLSLLALALKKEKECFASEKGNSLTPGVRKKEKELIVGP